QVVACAPVIYNIDRQTVMEADASGDWPDVEKKLLKAGLKEGTTFFAKVRPKKGAEENENILNGELSGK
ncbi:MAG: hypothetical protein KDD43_06920, partial [Bdellovibrionales bacterium]|nr:hypothetical protein [Bdellovibrionales bacterium]